jgi:hypothetical protein
MTATIRYEDVLRYVGTDADESDLYPGGFQCTLALFTPILERLSWVSSPEVLDKLADHLNDNQRQWLTQLAEAANRCNDAELADEISEELYHAQKEPRFGEHNPELMELAFWKFMVRRRRSAWSARAQFDSAHREYTRQLDAIPLPEPAEVASMNEAEKEALAATLPRYSYGGAVWCFQRFGMSSTSLPDGRTIYIAGEHEDFYDPDFYIYNDVIVIQPNLEIQIYAYPRKVFRPTDFHSATLVQGESIYIIGNLGYYGTREPGVTPVYRLGCQSYQMEKLATTGDNPGWISDHKAEYVAERHAIKVTQGKICVSGEGKRQFRQNRKVYWLDLATSQWSCGSKQREQKRQS